MNREELDLSYMGFDQEDKDFPKIDLRKVHIETMETKKKTIYKKIKVCLSY